MSSFIPITERRPEEKFPMQFSIIVNPETARDELIKKTNEYIADEKLFTKINKKKAKELSKMDKEIDQLNERIRQLSIHNYSLDQEIKKQVILRDQFQSEQTQIANYCNNLKQKYNNPDATIREYEDKIQIMKEENEKLLSDMDLKIENAEKLNKKIMNEIEDKIDTYNNHKATMVGSEQKLKDIEAEIENQRNVYKERAEINKLKYDELEKKYNNLEKKIMDLQMNSDIRKRQNRENKKKRKIQDSEKDELQKELFEIEKENEKLISEIEEMNQQYKDLTSSAALKQNLKPKRNNK